jgi:hypothetical protein
MKKIYLFYTLFEEKHLLKENPELAEQIRGSKP